MYYANPMGRSNTVSSLAENMLEVKLGHFFG
jgi:hypothetical protein